MDINPDAPIPPLHEIQLANLHTQLEADGKKIFALKKALRPFALLLQDHNSFDFNHKPYPNDKPIFAINGATITLGDLRRAYAAVVS